MQNQCSESNFSVVRIECRHNIFPNIHLGHIFLLQPAGNKLKFVINFKGKKSMQIGQNYRKTTQTSRKWGWINLDTWRKNMKSSWSYHWCAYARGRRSPPREIQRSNHKVYLGIIWPGSEAPACYHSLCPWSCLKLARSLALSFSPRLMPQMVSRLSHIVMLQCVNRRNYKRCTDTLLTSICADGRQRAKKESFSCSLDDFGNGNSGRF